MVSIIVCFVNYHKVEALKKSVDLTIGIPHEWLIADNRNTGKGICQVYNEQAIKAKFPFILFIHEDVTFDIDGWGARVISSFKENDNLGLVGVAGATFKSRSISGWFTGDKRYDRYQLVHSLPERRVYLDQLPNAEQPIFPVLCLDGVFLFCRKTVWEHTRFDDSNILGFHFYDIDFSLRVSRDYGVGVISALGLVHHTDREIGHDSRWVREAFSFHTRWQNQLPLTLTSNGGNELFIQRVWLDVLKDESISLKERWNWITCQKQLTKLTLLYPILKFLLYRRLRLRYLHYFLRRQK
jgi:hypothetical protein